MREIDSSFVIIHAFKNRDKCSIATLKQFKHAIEEIRKDVFVDVSLESIQCTVATYSSYFTLDEYEVRRKPELIAKLSNPDFIKYFDSAVGESICESIGVIFE